MLLYAGQSEPFINKSLHNEIAPTLEENFHRYFGYRPSPSEVNSWNVSLKDLAYSMKEADVAASSIIVEYRLPMNNKRLDAMLLGLGADQQQRGVIVELKQWKKADSCGIEDCVRLAPKDIHLHPSRQAGQYAEYLKGSHTAFYSDAGDSDYVDLLACSFLHHAHSDTCGSLLADEYAATLKNYPLFTGDLRTEFAAYLHGNVGHGDGKAALQRVTNSRYMPSRKLLDHVAAVIKGNEAFVLLDEQLVAFNTVLAKVQELERSKSKSAIIVQGGPGTGKSVIAAQLVGELARLGRNVVHATGSAAFTTNLKAHVGAQAASLFKSTHNMAHEQPDTIDVLIVDEAHRIREKTQMRYQKPSGKSQIDELLDASKVSVFLLDEHQDVRPGEIGTPRHVKAAALAKDASVWEFELQGQFRCAGAESYIQWVDHILELGGTSDHSWRADYEFAVYDSPAEMEFRLRELAAEGHRARIVAGFCWPWSDPNDDDTLVPDVGIGEWKRPWNRKRMGSTTSRRDPYFIWATQPQGFNEIGCIYSAQGMDFDYCGVIIGPDFIRNLEEDCWEAVASASHDKVVRRSDDLVRHFSNTYRVLLTRGMKGTFVTFTDEATKEYFLQRLAEMEESTLDGQGGKKAS